MRRYGLLGKTLRHSLSPQIHRTFGSYEYSLIEKQEDELAAFFKDPSVAAMNVTVPYKKAVLPFCTELDDIARRIGSVNTIRFDDEHVRGYNTDYAGFVYLLERSSINVAGKKALVLGSGGSSAAVRCALQDKGATVVIVSRSGENNYENLSRHADAAVVVNTTPVGMFPHTDEAPLSLDKLPQCEAVVDIIYNPLRTRLLQDAEARGMKTANGLAMLVAQGHRAAEIFTRDTLPLHLIEEGLRQLERDFQNIVLVGMPGCGKSTIAPLLAQALRKTVIDTDEEVERIAGTSIPSLFEAEGETGFREREAAVAQEVGKRSGLVIATGGGIVLRADNRAALRQNAKVVFLERDLDSLSVSGRPLSRDRAAIERLYQERLPLYRQIADVTVQVSGTPHETCRLIEEALKR